MFFVKDTFNKNKVIVIVSLLLITSSIFYIIYNIAAGINNSPKNEILYQNMIVSQGFSKELYDLKFKEKENEVYEYEKSQSAEEGNEKNSEQSADGGKSLKERKTKEIQGVKVPIYTQAEIKKMESEESTDVFIFNEEDYYAENVININMADKNSLMDLEGVDEILAESILKYRADHGGFLTAKAIKAVDGMTEEIYEKNKDIITVSKISKPKEKEN